MASRIVYQLSLVLTVIFALSSSNYYRGGTLAARVLTTAKLLNINDFGAKGDGKTDDSKAFQKAWKKACSSSSAVLLVVPSNKNYLLKPITFTGSCKSPITIQIRGKVSAWNDRSAYKDGRHWLLFNGVENLNVEGGGTIDGNGKIWWQNSCKINKKLPCKHAPTALTFYGCKNLRVGNLKVQNGQQMQVSFEKCANVKVSHIKVTAPGNSPNTDGIHIANTHNIVVRNTNIGTGDDCISIATGSELVRVLNITCGPGHGISIGSLGERNSKAFVSDVIVNGAILSGSTNGVRIKTWQGGSGAASNIKFQNIKLLNVYNPIIIDQNYCDQKTPCKKQGSAVQVKDVWYENIRGTSSSTTAVKFDCSEKYPCQGIVMKNVDIGGSGNALSTKATCNNVHLSLKGKVSPHC